MWTGCCCDYYHFCFGLFAIFPPLFMLIAPKIECILAQTSLRTIFQLLSFHFHFLHRFFLLLLLYESIHLRNSHRKMFETLQRGEMERERKSRKEWDQEKALKHQQPACTKRANETRIVNESGAKQNETKQNKTVRICKLSSSSGSGRGNSNSLGFNSYLQFMNKVCLLLHICWTFLVVNVLKIAKRERETVCVSEWVCKLCCRKTFHNIHRWLSFSLKCTSVLNYLFSLFLGFSPRFVFLLLWCALFLQFDSPCACTPWTVGAIPIHISRAENNLGRIRIHSSPSLSLIPIVSGLVKSTLILINNKKNIPHLLFLTLDALISHMHTPLLHWICFAPLFIISLCVKNAGKNGPNMITHFMEKSMSNYSIRIVSSSMHRKKDIFKGMFHWIVCFFLGDTRML